MVAGVAVQPLFECTCDQAQSLAPSRISTASKSRSVIDWRPQRTSISWTTSFWRSVGSPFFPPPQRRPAGRRFVHPPIVRRPPDIAPLVPETCAPVQSASAPSRPVPDSDSGTESCHPPAGSGCNKGHDAHADPFDKSNWVCRIVG